MEITVKHAKCCPHCICNSPFGFQISALWSNPFNQQNFTNSQNFNFLNAHGHLSLCNSSFGDSFWNYTNSPHRNFPNSTDQTGTKCCLPSGIQNAQLQFRIQEARILRASNAKDMFG